MSHPDPRHDVEHVRIDDEPYAPTRKSPTPPCPDCDGRGTFIHPPGDFWYSFSVDWCPSCDGTGRSPHDDQE
jgi:DnaJ-class molecular chaperone